MRTVLSLYSYTTTKEIKTTKNIIAKPASSLSQIHIHKLHTQALTHTHKHIKQMMQKRRENNKIGATTKKKQRMHTFERTSTTKLKVYLTQILNNRGRSNMSNKKKETRIT